MERVLKAVPADLRVKMEALVHDLTLALEESSNSANLRRRWGIRRRARSTGNIRKCKEEQFDALKNLSVRIKRSRDSRGYILSILIAPTMQLIAVLRGRDCYQDYSYKKEFLQIIKKSNVNHQVTCNELSSNIE